MNTREGLAHSAIDRISHDRLSECMSNVSLPNASNAVLDTPSSSHSNDAVMRVCAASIPHSSSNRVSNDDGGRMSQVIAASKRSRAYADRAVVASVNEASLRQEVDLWDERQLVSAVMMR